ncbi:hypothetical protein V6N11_025515 [Hibiscus sabdariffa]|uniref:Reverse transcriptase zinc-binding domain-containing protein n=2 Tax=Hibiscus sabdariffa TaxID=183260 RepID=A0ABR2NIL6_9ROSI
MSLFPESITRVSCSPLWRSLAHIWEEFRPNIAWCVCDGSLVDVWQDIWVPDVGRLCDQVTDPTIPFRHPTFSTLMTPSGSWNLSLLSSIFPTTVAHRILSIRCPLPNSGSDFCRWRWADRFSISSAYAKCMVNALAPCSNSWNIIWSQPIPQRLRTFLWLTFRQRLMTNLERKRRCLGTTSACPRCCSCETILHVLRDCSKARHVWSAIFGSVLAAHFYVDTLDIWLLWNLRCSMPTPFPNIPWPVLFASTCWHIWKSRNDSIFSGIDAPIASISSRVIAWSRHYSYVSSTAHVRQSVRDVPIPGWSALSSPWVCLNTDGAVCLHSSYARAGGVIRDCNGAWLAGFGLAISELSDTSAAHGFSILLRDILSLRQHNWVIQFLWVPRSANTVADHLLKQIPRTHFDMIHFDAPPDYIQSLLDRDMNSHHGLIDA